MTSRSGLSARPHRIFARLRPVIPSRRALTVCALVLAVMAASSAWLLLRSATFSVQAVRVDGTARLRADDVVGAAAVTPGTPLATLDTDAVARRVAALPPVRRVDVVRRWPGTVEIAIQERRPAAVRREGDGYLIVDESGVAFARAGKRPNGLSVITAPVRARASGGPQEPERLAFRAGLAVLADLPPALRRHVVEVRAISPDDVTLRLTRGRLVVWGSAERGVRKARVLSALLTRKAKVYDVSAPDTPTTRN